MRTVVNLLIALALITPAFAADLKTLSNASPPAENVLHRLPLCFIENRGQMDDCVAYYLLGRNRTLYFTPQGLSITLIDQEADDDCTARWCVGIDFLGTEGVRPRGRDEGKARFNYFRGKRSEWKTEIPIFGRIVYEDLWPGIDLIYSGSVGRLKYEFMVEPGSDPAQVLVAYQGASSVTVRPDGSLSVTTPAGSIEDGAPVAYQVIEGNRREISMKYVLSEKNTGDAQAIGFALGEYDPSLPLILDPALLIYCGYLGGKGEESGDGICVDDDGYVYVTGTTDSDHLSFPVKSGPDTTYNGSADAFVAKIDPKGQSLIFCGYIGGNDKDGGEDIAVDAAGCVYVTGIAYSDESTFPVLVGPDLTLNGKCDTFVAKINAQGTGLIYCGYIGGSGWDEVNALAVDGQGNVYLTGQTDSDESTFPIQVGPSLEFTGSEDGFIAKVSFDGSRLVYCGYMGEGLYYNAGNGKDIAVDTAGNAYVTGDIRISIGWEFRGIVAKVDAAGTGFDYYRYIKGDSMITAFGIAVNQEGYACFSGSTQGALNNVKVGPDLTYNGDFDVYVGKLSPDGTVFEYLGYIGGMKYDYNSALAIDDGCNLYVTGSTYTSETTFPVMLGPGLTYNGNGDVFLAKVKSCGTGLEYCGYIGGDDLEWSRDIAVDPRGSAYVIGRTMSEQNSFPVVVGPDLTHNSPYREADAFVAKVALALNAGNHTLSEQGGTVNLFLNGGLDRARRNYVVLGGASGTSPGFPLPGGQAVLPLNWDPFTELVLSMLNSPLFPGFQGKLDPAGEADAQINAPALPPGFVGFKLHFAWCLYNPFDFASNAVEVEIVS